MTLRAAADVVANLGEVFAVFDERSQDSSNVSYGVRTADGRRYFAKTAGVTDVSLGGLTREQRVALLRLDAQLHADVDHPALIALQDVIDAIDGVVVVYDWFDGALLNAPAARRNRPAEAHQRFGSLPLGEIVAALDSVIDLHVALEAAGWVAGDFYDGCLMYEFATGRIKVVDFECYRRGAYVNHTGRLPGSTRFMAPEEFRLGATVDTRTTVFNLARMVEIFLLARHDLSEIRGVVAKATETVPADRHASVSEFCDAWRSAARQARVRR